MVRRLAVLHERPVALDLAVPHRDESDDHEEPVQVVRNDRAVSCRVGPSEDGIEESPAPAAFERGTAALQWMLASYIISRDTSCERVAGYLR